MRKAMTVGKCGWHMYEFNVKILSFFYIKCWYVNKNWRGHSMQNASAVNRRDEELLKYGWNLNKDRRGFWFLRHSASPFHHQARPGNSIPRMRICQTAAVKVTQQDPCKGVWLQLLQAFSSRSLSGVARSQARLLCACARTSPLLSRQWGRRRPEGYSSFTRFPPRPGLSPHRSFPQPCIS